MGGIIYEKNYLPDIQRLKNRHGKKEKEVINMAFYNSAKSLPYARPSTQFKN